MLFVFNVEIILLLFFPAASLQRERTRSELPWPSPQMQHLLPHLQRCRQKDDRNSVEPSYEGEDNWRPYQRLSRMLNKKLWGSGHKRQNPQAPTPQAPSRNRQTRKVANAKGLNRNTNLT